MRIVEKIAGINGVAVGGEAMVTLELDGNADAELVKRLNALTDVYHVAYLAARGEAAL